MSFEHSYCYVDLFILHVLVLCLHACLYAMCMPDGHGGQKRALGPLKQNLQMVASQLLDPLQEQQVSKPLSHLPSLHIVFSTCIYENIFR